MFYQKRKFKNSKGLTLAAIYEGTNRDAPVVFICHGYLSSKDSESQEDLSKKLLQKGFSVYRFDFTACGDSEGSIYQHTPNQGLDDLNTAVKDLGVKDFALYG